MLEQTRIFSPKQRDCFACLIKTVLLATGIPTTMVTKGMHHMLSNLPCYGSIVRSTPYKDVAMIEPKDR